MRKILFYQTSAGAKPIETFLDHLSSKQAQKVAWVLKIVEDFERIPSQYFKKMVNTEDLWEVRITIESNIFRLLCFFDGPDIIVLTHALQKKTQKTPIQAIRIAEERKNDYFRRKYNE